MSKHHAETKKLFWISTITIGLMIIGYFIFSNNSYQIQKKKEIEIYYTNYFGDSELEIVRRFNKKNEGQIKVIPINLSFDMFSTNERKELFTRALRSKSDRIDIFAVDYIWASKFVKWAEPLDNHFSVIEREKLLDEAMEVCYYENKLIAIPLQIDIALMYYQNDILNEIPNFVEIEKKIENSITWKEFIELGKYFKGSHPFYLFPAENYEGLVCSYYEAILNQNPNFFDSEFPDFTKPEAKIAL